MKSENAKVKSEKVKVTVSTHQVVNYTQELELYPWEVERLKTEAMSESSTAIQDAILDKHINHKDVYFYDEYLDIEVMEES